MSVNIINGLSRISGISDISGITGVEKLSELKVNNDKKTSTSSFEAILNSAKTMVNETNYYQNAAEEAELQYAMGLMTNTHDLQVAQQKANLSLQYTVAVRNAVIDAYKEIMQLQF